MWSSILVRADPINRERPNGMDKPNNMKLKYFWCSRGTNEIAEGILFLLYHRIFEPSNSRPSATPPSLFFIRDDCDQRPLQKQLSNSSRESMVLGFYSIDFITAGWSVSSTSKGSLKDSKDVPTFQNQGAFPVLKV